MTGSAVQNQIILVVDLVLELPLKNEDDDEDEKDEALSGSFNPTASGAVVAKRGDSH
ncbi:MAG TPA: hypothetical protein VFZ59_25720 [Verrucomicrobiae bacterium]|nr:hypothetical protein [Verrucomicrobiae bacterium]